MTHKTGMRYNNLIDAGVALSELEAENAKLEAENEKYRLRMQKNSTLRKKIVKLETENKRLLSRRPMP